MRWTEGSDQVVNRNTANLTLAKGLQVRIACVLKALEVHVYFVCVAPAIKHLPQLLSGTNFLLASRDSFTSCLQLSISQTSPASSLSFKLSGKGWTLRHDSPMLVCN